MVSSFRQWESDPLFSAAEVVQDSADRMESIFRLLLHEQGLVHGEHPDPKLLSSIDYHRRDLATTLETAKWQLEDFEREVNLSAMSDNSQTRQIMISRHRQFIGAIKEQIIHVEKSLVETSVGGESLRDSGRINLDEQDSDGLALFLSGGKPVGNVAHHEPEDANNLRRFLDPTTSSCFSDEIDEQKPKEISLPMNGFSQSNLNFGLKESNLRNVNSLFSAPMGFETPSPIQDAFCNDYGEDGTRDLEADEAKGKVVFHKHKWRGNSRMNVFGSLGNLLSVYGSGESRKFTKRWKDGEEETHVSPYNDVTHAAQSHLSRMRLASGYASFQRFWLDSITRVMPSHGWLRDFSTRYQRSSYRIQMSNRCMLLISLILLTILFLGILASHIAF